MITLDQSGKGTCKVNTKNYKAGKLTFTGTYKSSGSFKSANGTTTLTVQPAKKAS
jgi:hypothetical protein